MTYAWGYEGGPPLSGRTLTLIDGVTFCISGQGGDITPGRQEGLFFKDTRYLSRLELRLDGASPEPLTDRLLAPYGGLFVSRRPPRAGRADSTLLVVRRRYVGAGMLEEITLRNLGVEPAAIEVNLLLDADLAGLFEVKEGRVRPSSRTATLEEAAITFSATAEDSARAARLSASPDPAVSETGFSWPVVVPAGGEWTATLQVAVEVDGEPVEPRFSEGRPIEASLPAVSHAAWRRAVSRVRSRDTGLELLVDQGLEAIGSLRIFDPIDPHAASVAAGAPWFMTLFGRDSIITSWMVLPFEPSLAVGTLRTLARLQGSRSEPLSEEEPGRILHEVRGGLEVAAALSGGAVYYGSVDATLLFVMLLGETRRWGVGFEELEQLVPNADRALEWAESYGDRDRDGFVEYQRATDKGLVNQGWKDSFDGISFASGRLAEPPIALAEVQGYLYAAYRARAYLARQLGEAERERECEERAEELRRRFEEAFWLEEPGYYAVGLDAEKSPIDSLTSNAGHCLWTGIAGEERAAAVARRLVGPQLFSGYGVRTLASDMGAYNPMSYHNGSVWAHDNAIVASGLMRYGHVEEAHKIIRGVLAAAPHFDYQLPELYCGFDSSEYSGPVPYPTSCSPQAWAAAAPLLFLRSLLGLEPELARGVLACRPEVPAELLPLEVMRLRIGESEVGFHLERQACRVTGLPEGLSLEKAT